MTVVVAGIAFLLASALAAGSVAVGRSAAAAARAQLAADAAALAAVAESAPFGGGRPRDVAAGYAEANGARLVECYCETGATTMQVLVAVGGAEAEARAHLDPELLAPAPGTTATGLHPVFAAALRRLLDAAGGRVHVTSGFRTTARQAELWAAAVERYGSPEAADDWVARPGSSMHERGVAVDLGGDLALAVRLVDELGLPLHRPLPHEPWHFELAGSRHPPE